MKVPSLLCLLRARSDDPTPDRRAYTFLADDGTEASVQTYAQLDTRARAIGATLNAALDGRREPVLLLFAPGMPYVEGFYGAMYGDAIPVPAYPPDPARLERTLPRLTSLVEDAGAKVVLTTSDILALAQGLSAFAPALGELKWIAVDAVDDAAAADWGEPELGPDDVCFLQYTSGSTSAPKGVRVTHGNLLANNRMIADAMGNDPDTVGVSWLPMYHDMGLIGHILQPLFLGIHSVLMSPLTFLKQPFRWLEAVSRYRATTSGGPNFAYDLCVRRIDEAQVASLDLSAWRLAYSGAEPVRPDTVSAFLEKFEPAGIRAESIFPCYGLAEATLLVTGGPNGRPPRRLTVADEGLQSGRVVDADDDDEAKRELVTCGRAPEGTELRIVDPKTRREAGADQVGEVWARGPHVADGYWSKDEKEGRTRASDEVFRARLATGEGPFLRTGDLGFVRDGELVVTGRLKDLIIVGGRNHYPQDVELTVERSHPSLRRGCAAAFTIEIGDEPHLAVAIEVERRFRQDRRREEKPREGGAARGADRRASGLPPGNEAPVPTKLDLDEVADVVRSAIWRHHELPLHTLVLLKAGTIPKTSSGKIQRNATRLAFLEGQLDTLGVDVARAHSSTRPYEPPQTPAEQLIANIWMDVLGVERVGRADTFVELGGDSVKAAQVVWRARERGLELSLQSMFEYPTLAGLSASASDRATPPPAAPGAPQSREVTPLSPLELDALAGSPDASAQTATIRGSGLEPERVLAAFRAVIAHHDALRSSVRRVDGRWVRSHAEVEPATAPIEWVSAEALDADETLERARARARALLDRESGQLAAVALLGVETPDAAAAPLRVVIALDALIADGVSWMVLFDDLDRAYRHLEAGEPVRLPKSTPFGDWVAGVSGRAERTSKPVLDRWLDQLAIPPAFGGARGDGDGEVIELRRSVKDVGHTLERLVRERGVNVLEFLTTATLMALHRHGGVNQRLDVLTSGRDDPETDLSRTVGRFRAREPVAVAVDPEATRDPLGTVSRHVSRLRELNAPYRALAHYHPAEDVRRELQRASRSRLLLHYGEWYAEAFTAPRIGYCTVDDAPEVEPDVAVLGGSLSGPALELKLRFRGDHFAEADMGAFLDAAVDITRELGVARADAGPGLVEKHQDSSLDDDQLAKVLRRARDKRR